MANPISEVKTDTQQLNANAEGIPTVAKDELLTNAEATEEAVATEEVATDQAVSLGATENTLDTSPDIAAASKDAHLAEIEPEVADFGVEQTGEHLTAKQTIKELGQTGATIVGSDHPATDLGRDEGTFNNVSPEQTWIPKEVQSLPNTEGNKWQRVWGNLRARIAKRKLLGGEKINELTPTNVAPLQQPIVTQTQERKAA